MTTLNSMVFFFFAVLFTENSESEGAESDFTTSESIEVSTLFGAVPKFENYTDGPHNMTITDGDDATFNCNTSALPRADVFWFLNGGVINTDEPREGFEFTEGNKRLTLRNVCRYCDGRVNVKGPMYVQCNASNIHGSVSGSGYLNILSKTTVSIDGDTDVHFYLNVRDSITLHCNVSSDPDAPAKAKWYKQIYGDKERTEIKQITDTTSKEYTGQGTSTTGMEIKSTTETTDHTSSITDRHTDYKQFTTIYEMPTPPAVETDTRRRRSYKMEMPVLSYSSFILTVSVDIPENNESVSDEWQYVQYICVGDNKFSREEKVVSLHYNDKEICTRKGVSNSSSNCSGYNSIETTSIKERAPEATTIVTKAVEAAAFYGQNDSSEKGNRLNNFKEPTEIVHYLSEMTNETNRLSTDDLLKSIGAIDKLAQNRSEGTQTPKRSEISSVIRAISNILEPSNNESWKSVLQNDKTAAAKLMSSADIYGRRLCFANKTDNETIIESTQNIVLESICLKTDGHKYKGSFPSYRWNETRTDSITIDLAAFDKSQWKGDTTLSLHSVYYRNIDNYLPTTSNYLLDSRVLSLAISLRSGENHTLTYGTLPVFITLQHNEAKKGNLYRHCVFWKSNFGGGWSNEGCTVVTSNETQTVCSCSHLTNFAILMSRYPSPDYPLSVLSTVLCSVSAAALVLTVIIYVSTWNQSKSHQAVLLLNLCVSLIIAYVIFIAGADKRGLSLQEQIGCKVVAVLLQYFFLAAFFIMLAEGIQLFIYVVFVFHVRRTIETAMLIAAAWVLPMVIIGISVGVTKTKGYGEGKTSTCWLSVEDHLIWAFVGPAFVILGINVAIILIVLVKLSVSRMPSVKKEENNEIRKMLWNLSVICPVLGIAWLFGILSINLDSVVLQYLFVIFNCSQGTFIFIFHAILTNEKFKKKISSMRRQRTKRERRKQSEKKRRLTQKLSSNKTGKLEPLTINGENIEPTAEEMDNLGFSDSGETLTPTTAVASDSSEKSPASASVTEDTSFTTVYIL